MRVDPNYVSGLVATLGSLTGSQQQLSTELSSGLRVSSASDDPIAAGQAAQLGTAIRRDDTFVQTAASTQGQIQVADSALGSVVTQLTAALSLAVQANNGIFNSANRTSFAERLSGIRDEVVSLANTSYQGSYIFAGSKGNTQPYTIDTSTSPATATYHGDTQLGTVTTPAGQTIQTGLSGSQLFSAPGADVLAALHNLIADFVSGTASPGAVADVGALTSALSNVSEQRSVLDSSLNRLESASTYAQTDQTERTVAQSSLVAADVATVATQLSAVSTQRQAMMSVIASDEKGSLFDFTH